MEIHQVESTTPGVVVPSTQPEVPVFEGHTVATTKLRLVTPSSIDINNEVLRMDDIVRIVVEGRVTKVDHVVNEKTGELERIQTVKVLDVGFQPWGPNDRGILA